jgi:hypothetical protein
MTIYRNRDLDLLRQLAVTLIARGHTVGNIVAPVNPHVDGEPYLGTSASNWQIMQALHERPEAADHPVQVLWRDEEEP